MSKLLIVDIILILILLFPRYEIAHKQADYLSKDNTLAIKGFSVMLVFFSHFQSYVALSNNILDTSFVWINGQIGQLCVVMFLFFSGYGLWYSLTQKENYVLYFLKRRLFPTWLSFAICVLLFIIEDILLGYKYSTYEIVLSFSGWTSVGNSNWYMFVVFVLYIMFYLCFVHCTEKQRIVRISIYSLICVALVILLSFVKEPWWWNSMLCMPAGMWFAQLKERIDCYLFSDNRKYVKTLLLSFIILAITWLLYKWHGFFFVIFSIQFCLTVCLIIQKIRFKSKILAFIGKHVFSIYILQRLVFNLGQHIGMNKNPYMFFVFSLLCTILIAVGYDKCYDKINKLLLINDR